MFRIQIQIPKNPAKKPRNQFPGLFPMVREMGLEPTVLFRLYVVALATFEIRFQSRFQLRTLIDILVHPGLGQLVDALLMKIVIDSHHCGRRFTMGAPVLFNDFYHLIMNRSLMPILLGRNIEQHLCKSWMLRFQFSCPFGILLYIVDLDRKSVV